MNLGSLIGYLGLDTKEWDQGLDRAEGGLKSFAKKGAVVAAAAGAAIAGAVTAAVVGGMNIEAGTDKLAAQLNLSGPDAERAGKLAGELYAGAYVGSLEEGGTLVRSIAQNIGTDLNSVEFSEIAAKVADLSNGFDQDLGATTKAVGQLMKTGLAANADEALDIVTAGFQSGADASGDFLDTLNEYGVQFQKLGLDGETATGLISQGMQAGARDSDLVADALKELSIRAIDGSEAAAAGYEALGLNAEEMTAKMAAGGAGAKEGLDQILDGLRNVEDPVARSAAAVGLFGTQAEDLGAALFSLDPSTAAAGLGELEGRASDFGKTLNDNAVTALTSFKNQAQLAFFGLANNVLPIVNSVASALATQFGPALKTVGGFLSGTVVPALQGMAQWMEANRTPLIIVAGIITAVFIPHLIALAAQATLTGATTAAMWLASKVGAIQAAAAHSVTVVKMVAGWVLMGAQSLIQAARMAAAWLIAMGPVGWVIAAVVGLVALIIANWDTVVSWTKTAWSAVSGAVGAAWDWIKGVVSAGFSFVVGLFMNFTGPGLIIKHWETIKSATGAAWDWIKNAVKAGFAFIVNLFLNFTGPGLIIKHWETIKNAFSAGVSASIGFVASLPGRAASALSSLGSAIVNVARNAWSGFSGAVSAGIGAAVSLIAGLPGRAAGAIGSLGGVLVSAGRSLITGFIDGIKGAIGGVKDTLGGLTSKLTSWKGPPARDAVLLQGAGQLVIEGFINGLESRFGAVRSTLQGLTTDLSATGTVGVGMPATAAGSLAGSQAAAFGGRETTINVTANWNERDIARVVRQVLHERDTLSPAW